MFIVFVILKTEHTEIEMPERHLRQMSFWSGAIESYVRILALTIEVIEVLCVIIYKIPAFAGMTGFCSLAPLLQIRFAS